MGSRWAAAAASSWCCCGGVSDDDRPKTGLVGFGRMTVCGGGGPARLDADRATGLAGIGAVQAVRTRHGGDGGRCSSDGTVGAGSLEDGGGGGGGSLVDGGVWPRATASAVTTALERSTTMGTAQFGMAAAADVGGGTCDSSARDTDLARYSTSRRPTTESRPGKDSRKLHASLAQWLNPSCKHDGVQKFRHFAKTQPYTYGRGSDKVAFFFG